VLAATPVTVPSAPVRLIATPGDTQVSITFAQESTGGSAITNYQYSTDNGATFITFIPTVTASPVVITGLTNGTTYQIQLKALNVMGTSAASATVSATPATVPSTPDITSASNGNARATINFTQGSDGGSSILNYYYSTDDGATFSECSPTVTATPVIITGLTNGTTYQIRLKAINIIGLSDVSNNISVTPFGPPDAPTDLVATPGDTQVSIAFTQGSDGGSPITNYYYSTDNGASFYTLSPPSTVSPVVITGLTNGTTYDIKLQAVNLAGASAASSAVSATPVA
jgi:titin